MKKFVAALVLLIAVMAGSFPLAAQQSCGNYQPKEGDTLWNLAASTWGSGQFWTRIWDQNPQLHQPGRLYDNVNGVKIAKIYTTDCLQGIPVKWVRPPVTEVFVAPTPIEPTKYASASTPMFDGQEFGLMAIAILVALLAVWWLLNRIRLREAETQKRLRREEIAREQTREKNLNADPAAENPIVPGGLTDKAHAKAKSVEVAAQRWRHSYPESMFTVRDFTIVNISEGFASGIVLVHYSDGSWIERRLASEPAFQAIIRNPNGRMQEVFMLQRCGNDLKYGVDHYEPHEQFRFTATKRTSRKKAEIVAMPGQASSA